MKWNDEIREIGTDDGVYSRKLAEQLFIDNKYTAHELSLMKQENIRMYFKEGIEEDKINIKLDLRKRCGYCFEARTVIAGGGRHCDFCPIQHCMDNIELDAMMSAKSFEEIADAHKAWCIELGLWKGDWE